MGLVSNDKAEERLNNPNNLMNRLRSTNDNKKNNGMQLFGVGIRSLTNPTSNTGRNETVIPAVENREIKTDFNPFGHKEETNIIPSHPNTIIPKTEVPASPSITQLLPESEAQIRLGHAHDKAIGLLTDSVDELKLRLGEIKADKLPSVISSASKVIESIRRERIEVNKKNNGQEVHFHFYTPEQKKIDDYEVIEV